MPPITSMYTLKFTIPSRKIENGLFKSPNLSTFIIRIYILHFIMIIVIRSLCWCVRTNSKILCIQNPLGYCIAVPHKEFIFLFLFHSILLLFFFGFHSFRAISRDEDLLLVQQQHIESHCIWWLRRTMNMCVCVLVDCAIQSPYECVCVYVCVIYSRSIIYISFSPHWLSS